LNRAACGLPVSWKLAIISFSAHLALNFSGFVLGVGVGGPFSLPESR
jgi:hypothetical protein